VVLQIVPVVGDLAALAPCGGVVWLRVADWRQRAAIAALRAQRVPVDAGECRLLILTGRVGLARRNMGSRRRVRPDRLGHPRGFRCAAEAQEPCQEMGAMLLKRRQDGLAGEAGHL
jgi:hypothetical protein